MTSPKRRTWASKLLRRRKRRRLVALIAFRDEMRFLPDLFANLEGQVDGVIGLDDQSVDESREFFEAQPLTIDVLSVPQGAQEEMEDGRNHRTLIEAAWEHDADWLLGIDADERVERDFRRRAEGEMKRAEEEGQTALWIPFRELWDAPDQMRMDGLWGEKRKGALFRSDRDHRFDDRRLHSIWIPLPPEGSEHPTADLRIYHLRMVHEEDRRGRVERYRRLDPDRKWQEMGYDYLVDEEGIRLEPLEPGREYRPLRV